MDPPLRRKRSFTGDDECPDTFASHSAKRRRSRSISSGEEITRLDDDLPPNAHPPPSAHELDRLNYHIRLKDIGSALQKAANAIFPGKQASRYSKVDVMLLSWEAEDPNLPVSVEINELEDVFTNIYRYDVEKWLIPSDNCHNLLQTKVLEFLGSNDPEHLKIVYYAGHGKLTNHGQPAWTSRRNSRKDRCPTVKWSGIQNTLEESQSDVLILLDCCASGVCTTDEGNGVTELIAACAYNAIANGVGPFSFTHALIAKLRLLAQLPYFTIGYLYNALFTEIQGWRLEDSRHKKAPVHLVLSQNSELPRSIRLSSHSKGKGKVDTRPSATDLLNFTPSTYQDTPETSHSPGCPASHKTSSDGSHQPEDTSPFSSATSPPSSMTSMSQLPEYPRLLFSVRIHEDVKPGELSTELFADWLREIPVVARFVRVEAGFASDSTLLMVSMPVAMLAYLPPSRAITLLGTTRSGNLLKLPTKGTQAATVSSATMDPNIHSKEETPRLSLSAVAHANASSLQNQGVDAIIQGARHLAPTKVINSLQGPQEFDASSTPSVSTVSQPQQQSRPQVPMFKQPSSSVPNVTAQDFQMGQIAEYSLQNSFDLFSEHFDWNSSENGFTDSAIGSTEFSRLDLSDFARFEGPATPFTTTDLSLVDDHWQALFPDDVSIEQPQNKQPPLSPDADNPISKHLQSSSKKPSAIWPSSEVYSWLSSIKDLRDEIDLPPIVVEDPNDTVAIKRARNTLAARKSRKRKMQKIDELESLITKLQSERDHWKEITLTRSDAATVEQPPLQGVSDLSGHSSEKRFIPKLKLPDARPNSTYETLRAKEKTYSEVGIKLKREMDGLLRLKDKDSEKKVSESDRKLGLVIGLESIVAYMHAFYFNDLGNLHRGCQSTHWESLLCLLQFINYQVRGDEVLRALSAQVGAVCHEQVERILVHSMDVKNYEKMKVNTKKRNQEWSLAQRYKKALSDLGVTDMLGPWSSVKEATELALDVLARYAKRENVDWKRDTEL